MKKLMYLLLIVGVAVSAGCEKKTNPVDYNNTIINEQAKVVDIVLDFNAKIDIDSFKQARVLLDKTGIQCDSSIKAVEALGDYEGDASFKNAAIDLFKFYKRASVQDYKELLDLIEKEEMTDEDYDRVTLILQNLKNEEEVLDDKVRTAQKAFADKHGVKITGNPIQDKIDNIEKE